MDRSSICYVERQPRPALSWAVESFWSLDGHLVGEAAALPKPYVELVVSLADPHRWRAGGASTGFVGGWITPIQSGPRYSRACGLTRFVAARLRPAAAAAAFGPLPLGDGAPPLCAAAVIGPAFAGLRNRLAEAPTVSARLDILETWLADRLPAPAIMALSPPPFWRADSLSRHLGLSDRAARRRFQQVIGCSPKYWLRLHRLAAILQRPAFQQGTETLAATAARFGLADQAHLAREFRLLAGMPPSAYQRRRAAHGLTDAPTMAPRS